MKELVTIASNTHGVITEKGDLAAQVEIILVMSEPMLEIYKKREAAPPVEPLLQECNLCHDLKPMSEIRIQESGQMLCPMCDSDVADCG